jgi:hypothetical protein
LPGKLYTSEVLKNQYVGDINDFAKYGLLRSLARVQDGNSCRLGVVWYLTSDVSNGDGGRIGYLALPRPNHYTAVDVELLDLLEQVVRDGRRDVHEIAARGVLPPNTAYWSDLLFGGNRQDWFAGALAATFDCDLLFLDPDNGLERTNGVRPKPQHATVDEVLKVVNRDQSVVVIQFLNRLAAHRQQLETWLGTLRRAIPATSPDPFALHWHGRGAYGSLGFFVVPSRRHSNALTRQAQQMVSGPWGRYFELVQGWR